MTTELERLDEKYRSASRFYENVRADYHARRVDDDTFLAARKVRDDARFLWERAHNQEEVRRFIDHYASGAYKAKEG